jgi:hypothetical protein
MARKFKFAEAAQRREIPKEAFIWSLGSPVCPHCRMVFDMSIKQDEFGNPTNFDPETNTITVEHGNFRNDCPLNGRRLRWTLPMVKAEVVA